MAARQDSAVEVSGPDELDIKATEPRRSAGRRRRSRGKGPGSALETVIEELERRDFQVVKELEIRRKAPRRAARRGPPGAARVDVQVAPGEGAVVLVERDGVLSWEIGAPLEPRQPRRRRGREPAGVRFEIDMESDTTREKRRGSRGLLDVVKDFIVDEIRGVVLKFAAGLVVTAAQKILERNVVTGLVSLEGDDSTKWVPLSDPSQIPGLNAASPRVLLWVHGTFSSTRGSFGAFAGSEWGQSLLAAAHNKYDAVLGYDHRTLGDDPSENAIEILRSLQGLPWQSPPTFDGVGYSRGGLVLRALIESELPLSQWGARFQNAIFIGATNNGTELAQPENWQTLLDFYTNLAVGTSKIITLATGNPVAAAAGEVVDGIFTFAKYLSVTAIQDRRIPGLAAMEPDGAFVTEINRTQPAQPSVSDLSYYAVASNFERNDQMQQATGLPTRLFQKLADGLVDRLMGEANDLVVDTDSMTTIDPHTPGYLRETALFDKNSGVHHLSYFVQEETAKAIRKWLHLPEVQDRRKAKSRGKGREAFPSFSVRYMDRETMEAGSAEPAAVERGDGRKHPRLQIEVVWGEVASVEAKAYAVGHYEGVEPQRAEAAIDAMITWTAEQRNDEKLERRPDQGVINQLMKRRGLRGDVGQITALPIAGTDRLALICGMGYPGSFDAGAQRALYQNLATYLMTLPGRCDLCTVLIGSGDGGLPVDEAVRGMLLGFSDALGAEDGSRVSGDAENGRSGRGRVRIVETGLRKAHAILRELQKISEAQENSQGRGNATSIPLRIDLLTEEIEGGKGGVVSPSTAVSRLLSQAVVQHKQNNLDLFEKIGGFAEEQDIDELRRWIENAPDGFNEIFRQIHVELRDELTPDTSDSAAAPSRLSFVREGGIYRVSAISSDATVPERIIDLTEQLVKDVTAQAMDPPLEEIERLPAFLYGLFVPRDFRELLARETPLVLEIDRETAAIPWEMLASSDRNGTSEPIALRRQVSRQLRTTYSPPPLQALGPGMKRRALVIGDPGDPSHGDDLPEARNEAIEVALNLARNQLFEVLLLLGPGPMPRDGERLTVKRASYVETLRHLLEGEFELVHYAGHADFEPEDPQMAGWLFHDGFLTSREIARIDRAPRIVVANACLSAQSSRRTRTEGGLESPWGEAGLLPSLADEFYRRGVGHYIGTAWEVDDEGAVLFSTELYRNFFGERGKGKTTMGEAMHRARGELKNYESQYGALWAAYQHYGDPNDCDRADPNEDDR